MNNQTINRLSQRINSQKPFQQSNNVQKNESNSVKIMLSQCLKSNALSLNQKILIHNLMALLCLALEEKFTFITEQHDNHEPFNSSHNELFTPIQPFPTIFFIKTEIIKLITQLGICAEGKEEKCLDLIMEICTEEPGSKDISNEGKKRDFTPSAKKLLAELNIEERPAIIEKIIVMLNELKLVPIGISDELKKKLFSILKDSEEDDEIEELKFDYAEISEV